MAQLERDAIFCLFLLAMSNVVVDVEAGGAMVEETAKPQTPGSVVVDDDDATRNSAAAARVLIILSSLLHCM